MNLSFSEIESTELRLRVARCNDEQINPEDLQKLILKGKYDLVRLKLPAEEEMASANLSQLGFPFFYSGSIRRYSTPITYKPSKGYLNPTLEFVGYDGSQKVMLHSLLADTWGDYPIGYYRTPILQHLVSKEVELECVLQYYDRHNGKTNWPDSSIMLMLDKGETVGFFALNKINGNLESHIGGILRSHQKRGYFFDMLTFIRNYCVDNGLPKFLFGARNENAQVQRIFERVGFSSIGNDNVFHILPMITWSSQPIDETIINVSGVDLYSDFHSLLYNAAIRQRSKISNHSFADVSFRTIYNTFFQPIGDFQLRVSTPLCISKENYIVVAVHKLNQSVPSMLAYLWSKS